MIMDKIALTLLIIGGLNWGSVGLFRFDLVAFACGGSGSMISRVIYTLVGLSRRVVHLSALPGQRTPWRSGAEASPPFHSEHVIFKPAAGSPGGRYFTFLLSDFTALYADLTYPLFRILHFFFYTEPCTPEETQNECNKGKILHEKTDLHGAVSGP